MESDGSSGASQNIIDIFLLLRYVWGMWRLPRGADADEKHAEVGGHLLSVAQHTYDNEREDTIHATCKSKMQ